MVATCAGMFALSVAFSGIGWKLRCFADSFACAKLRPDATKICCARGSWIQLSNGVCTAEGFCRTMSNIVFVLEFLTVFQPYDAGAVSWTIRTPAAPRRAASSYL